MADVEKQIMLEIFKKFTPKEQDIILRYHQQVAYVIVAGATILKVLDEADLLDKKKGR
jgi:hypothetical protein